MTSFCSFFVPKFRTKISNVDPGIIYVGFCSRRENHCANIADCDIVENQLRPVMANSTQRPKFDELPLGSKDPPFSAWGLYGPDDELGTLNLITPDAVVKAAKEIQLGIRIGLDLPLDFSARPSHYRQPLTHTVLRKHPRLVHDDVLNFNSQISTQWDGFRHYGYQREQVFYGGVKTEQISGPADTTKQGMDAWYQGPSVSPRLGIHHWTKEGIVGRGVLLDYYRWAEKQGKHYDPLSGHAISADDLQACAEAQGVQFESGDILLVRTGWTLGYRGLDHDGKIKFSHAEPTILTGVETSIATARWLWSNEFSACGGDAPGWEKWPALPGAGEVGGIGHYRLHEIMLNGWGMPIGKSYLCIGFLGLIREGEMFDLERPSEECSRVNRWTFYFSSMPIHVIGGVASPCNAVAVL